ncbi:hypothetical protein BDW42DRAFT_146230 [Aspergillus taichungensis]|uniref:Wax synthase domain-containing protein n=1 Tax=Aspergillus taichungensis TaxID=482145 RepID=A0A2J5HM65_9EURO|nr:hypothetical protein BDW42DRAFT_146230 [Aspergillus taichungensis]
MVATDFTPYVTEWMERHLELEKLLQQGEFQPVLLHHYLCLIGPLFFTLMISRQSAPFVLYLRYLAFAWTVFVGTWIIRTCRASFGGNGAFIGLGVSFIIMRAATLLIFRDPESEFRRLEKRYLPKRRTVKSASVVAPVEQRHEFLVWQGYPSSFGHRLSWAIHLICSARGSHWNWRVRSSGPIPKAAREQMLQSQPEPISLQSVASDQVPGRVQDRLWYFLGVFAEQQLLIMLMEEFAARDPYFLGHGDMDWQISFLSRTWSFSASSPITRVCRTYLVAAGAKVWSVYAHAAAATILLAFYVAFPSIAHSLFPVPMNEAWMVPNATGPFSAVLDHGFVGLCGSYWHQNLRFDFLQWTGWVVSLFPTKSQTPALRSVAYTVVPFVVSAAMHACGSYTQFAETSPLGSMVSCALVAAFGVGMQRIWLAIILPRAFPERQISPGIAKTANVVFAALVTLMVATPFSNDIAAGGMYAHLAADFHRDVFAEIRPHNPSPIILWRGETWWKSGIRVR